MELTGKQKAQLLISLLEDNSSDVLKYLSKDSAARLSASLDDVPVLQDAQMQQYLTDTVSLIREKELDLVEPGNDDGLDDLNLDDSSSNEEGQLTTEDQADSDDIEVEEKVEFPENYRSIDRIAEELLKQQDQIIAFFLKNVEQELGKLITKKLPEELLSRIEEHKVEKNPMSEKVYKRLFDLIVIKNEADIQAEKESDSMGGDDSFDLGF